MDLNKLKTLSCFLTVILICLPYRLEASVIADDVFDFSAAIEKEGHIRLHWSIKKPNFLYKEYITIEATDPEKVVLGKFKFSKGEIKKSIVLGQTVIFKDNLNVIVPIQNYTNVTRAELMVEYIGCMENGNCYPPVNRNVTFDFTENFITVTSKKEKSNSQSIAEKLGSNRLLQSVLAFLGFGILLSFTPCVLPMIPILSGLIISNQKNNSRTKPFWLSVIYVLGMSSAYAMAGIVVSSLGTNIQAYLQNTYVLITFSLLFVILALSLFGLYEIQLPSGLMQKLVAFNNKQKSGSYLGVGVMGVLSTLIVSPCVTPPLIGALAFLSQTGEVITGAAALFSLGLGMGIPLIVVGTMGGKFLPKAGPWMKKVKTVCGLALLGVAIWLWQRIIPEPVAMALWGILIIALAVILGLFEGIPKSHSSKLFRVISLVICLYGGSLVVGAMIGNSNFLDPLSIVLPKPGGKTNYIGVRSIPEIDHYLLVARENRKPVMIDFYADWCVDCRVIHKTVFNHPKVSVLLDRVLILHVDVTKNSKMDQQIQKKYNVVGPPACIFYDANGVRRSGLDTVGYVSEQDFRARLQELL